MIIQTRVCDACGLPIEDGEKPRASASPPDGIYRLAVNKSGDHSVKSRIPTLHVAAEHLHDTCRQVLESALVSATEQLRDGVKLQDADFRLMCGDSHG